MDQQSQQQSPYSSLRDNDNVTTRSYDHVQYITGSTCDTSVGVGVDVGTGADNCIIVITNDDDPDANGLYDTPAQRT